MVDVTAGFERVLLIRRTKWSMDIHNPIGRALVLGLLYSASEILAAAVPEPRSNVPTQTACLGAANRACVLEQALRDAQAIPNELWRVHMLIVLGKAASNSAPIEEALRVARSIKLERLRAVATAAVGGGQAELGLKEDAANSLAEALEMARSVMAGMPANVGPSALGPVARAEARAGRRQEAVEIARGIEDVQDRGLTLSFIAFTQAQAGRYAEALEIARSIDAVHGQAQALRSVAEMQARAGRVSDALGIVPAIGVEQERALLIESVVEIQAQAGKITEALHLAQSIGPEATRCRALLSVR